MQCSAVQCCAVQCSAALSNIAELSTALPPSIEDTLSHSPILAREETKIQRAMMKGISTLSKSTWKTSYSCFSCASWAGL